MNYRTNSIEIFLDKLDIIRKKYDQIEAQKDQFNIFSALRENYDEVKLHSRFIASLISWTTHDKYLFLDKFIKEINSEFIYNTDSLEIYPSYDDKSEFNDIDILLIDRTTRHAIIIENKIYAPDSNHQEEGQLEKYYRIIVENEKILEKNVEVLYLTLDGHEPSKDSVSTSNYYPHLKELVKCISYSIHIKNWLTECVKSAYDKPFQRETILQYIKLINDMTNQSEQEELLEIIRLIGETESNVRSAKLLFDNINHIHWHTISLFWNGLAHALSSHEYKVLHKPTNEDFDNIVHVGPKKKKQAHLYIDFNINNTFTIRIEEFYDTSINYGIEKKHKVSPKYTQAFKTLAKQDGNKYLDDKEWYIYRFPLQIYEEEFSSWDITNNATFNLIRDDFRNRIIKKIVTDIDHFVKEVNMLANKKN